ncbi:MAG: hypothetical protein SVV03_03850 [Candidatus Nanohaloarchaea archaeon]|nr:hypothetical protein [Candidatus Nanohaloarchaea archaeon]
MSNLFGEKGKNGSKEKDTETDSFYIIRNTSYEPTDFSSAGSCQTMILQESKVSTIHDRDPEIGHKKHRPEIELEEIEVPSRYSLSDPEPIELRRYRTLNNETPQSYRKILYNSCKLEEMYGLIKRRVQKAGEFLYSCLTDAERTIPGVRGILERDEVENSLVNYRFSSSGFIPEMDLKVLGKETKEQEDSIEEILDLTGLADIRDTIESNQKLRKNHWENSTRRGIYVAGEDLTGLYSAEGILDIGKESAELEQLHRKGVIL